ncbi:cGMP-dependent 3',5'-cyclic phosphodiesterase-like isoform X1 [Mizuhopecten yessoensis]|uniref:cGMP-dependent 3',5'-cyclic phosphodiesterase-like isoform X1 n=1 Tax=Mizuhopecten yessoensis TaxID=6573 RepID=UPI000B45E410|nr:cGMP-dependent 3',5'-cyclic phosphodiesterase-like isoform X1 [Mizuhopecten yessoensis]
MVIVFNHVLVSSFLFYRNPHRFLVDAGCKTNGDAGSGKSKQSEKDGETKLWEKSDFRSLHEQVKEAINYIASKSVTSLVYLLDKDSGELYADKENTKKLPKNGICWEAWSMRKARACHNLDPGDPLVSELSAQQDNTGWKPKSVLCYPIDDSQSGRCIALIVVGSNFGEEIDAHSLMPLAEQIVACYRNMCKCDGSTGDQYRETSPPTSSTTTSDKEAIVKLCGELYDQNTADLQRKIVRYLEEHTNAEFGFMLLVVPETQELYCQVIGDKVLDQEIRFPLLFSDKVGETSPFSAVLESKDPLRLENITEDKKKEMEVLLGRSLQSLMCVPVTSRNYDGLVAIACVANKFGTDSFTSEDLQTIQTCFKYTAAILTNTLAFQNERKLKKQTQAMLEVAKNLFTHLGELSSIHCRGLDDFPVLPSNGVGVNVRGYSYADYLKQEQDYLATRCCPQGGATSLQHNNSARISARNINKEIQQRGILAEKLTGCFDFDYIGHMSHEKVKGYQVHPKIKSPEHKQVRKANDKVSPQKESVSPYKLPEGRRQDMTNLEDAVDDELLLPAIDSLVPCRMSDVSPSEFVLLNVSRTRFRAGEEIPDQYPPSDTSLCSTDFQYYVRECWTSQDGDNCIENTQSATHHSADHLGTGLLCSGAIPGSEVDEEDIKDGGASSNTSSIYTLAELTRDVTEDKNYENISKDSLLKDVANTECIQGGLLYQTVVGAFRDAGNDTAVFPECVDVTDTSLKQLDSASAALDTTLTVQTGYKPEQCSEFDFSSNSGPKSDAPVPANSVSTSPVSSSPDSASPASQYVPSENSSEMFTCVEFEASDLNGDVNEFSSGSDVEDIALDCPQLSFHDAWSGSSEKVKVCRSLPLNSQMHAVEGYETDLSKILDAPISNPRFSTSDPAIHRFVPENEFLESKPNLNYAFCQGSSTDSVVSAGSRKRQVLTSTLGLVSSLDQIGISPSQSGLCDHTIIVEDTESRVSHTYIIPSDSLTSNSSEDLPLGSGDSTQGPSCPCLGPSRTAQNNKSMIDMIKLQPPSTEALPITKNDLTKLLREIMQEARNLTQAERCSVFLIDEETEELVAKVFDGITTNDKEVQSEIRMPIIQGIAGHVATTGKLLNIKDAYSHPMFYRGIDDSTGFRTRNILCFPIKNEAGNVLGVAQLCNKKTGPFFTVFDEDVASAFAVYCCISISHSLMYQRVIAAQIRNSLANELMMYHMKVAQEEVDTLAHMEINSPSFWHADFDKFSFPPRMIPEDDTEMACLTMFEDLGFITKFRIRRDTLARFVLMVRRGYRNPPYHNWMHAFAVTHFCYVCMKNLKLTQYLEDIEMFSLFTSCMCHDIDHRGTNNSYQSVSKSVLAALYSSEGSVLERHHFAQSMCIVNTDGCNLFENLSSKDYQQALDLMRDIILATDLAHHLRILKNIETMAKTGYDKENTKHHKLLLCLLMTASDLSDQTKPWDSTKHIAALIYKEFFSQGDMEKSMGREPIEMMDRERARIPDLQIGFLDHIALPVYKVLAELFPAANSVKVAVEDNRRHWDKICALIKIRRGGSCEQMSYDQILALEAEDHLPQTNQSNHIQ